MSVFPNIALMGRARSGKDTIAARLQQRYAYARVAFADPLKEAALKLDPYVYMPNLDDSTRLSILVEVYGWEYAKEKWPEVRRLLQHMGQTVREYDEDFWLNIAARKISGAAGWGIPVVVTDVRYPNEAEALKRAGFRMVRVVRPERESGDTHESETALQAYPADVVVRNSGTLDDLYAKAEALAKV